MNPLKTLSSIPIENQTLIHYNGITCIYSNKYKNDEINNLQLWGAFGMMLQTNGPIINFIINTIPNDTAIICVCGDYHFPIKNELSRLFKRVFLIVRYNGIPNSIVIPGDDIFFENTSFYAPKDPILFENRLNEVFWRGSCTAELRKDIVIALHNIPNTNVKLIKNDGRENADYWTIPQCFGEKCDHNEYSKRKIWLSIEGWGCASDTTRALMSGSAVIYYRNTSPWFNSYLKNGENCIIITVGDINGLIMIINKMINNTEFTKRIAYEGKKLADRIFKPVFYKNFILDQYRMNLVELVDNSRTDKNTTHSYLELYHRLLSGKRESAKNVLEIGIWMGGSIKLWSDFFINAHVYGLDMMEEKNIWDGIKKDNITLHTSTDAYNEDFFKVNFLEKNIRCDFMLDDGPHTLESMKKFITLYSQIMTDDGILIIEDVQDWDWIEILKKEVPEHLKQYVKTYDLRANKGRYDDIVFTINKHIY